MTTTLDTSVHDAITGGLTALSTLESQVDGLISGLDKAASSVRLQYGDGAGSEVLDQYAQHCGELRDQVRGRFERQRERLTTFNLVLFGRTGAGKSSLIEALSSGNGEPISRGESDWTTDIRDVRWQGCRLVDTPGIAGWGRTMSRAELEARAAKAVEDADVVLLCFDTQSQQAGEFETVADWIARYRKPVVAVLNCRNARWRFPTRVPTASARRQLSQTVAEHAGNIRDELARIGLTDVPVLALNTKRASFARTKDPYAGPDSASRQKLREEVGVERLEAWSNLDALERLLAGALDTQAEALRLGMLYEQSRGVLVGARELLGITAGEQALQLVKQLEGGIGDVLRLLGRPSDDELAESLAELESARAGGFDAPVRGEVETHARHKLTAALRPVKRDALRRAERLIDRAFEDREEVSPEYFGERVIEPALAEIELEVEELFEEVSNYLTQRLQVIAQDVRADLSAVSAETARIAGGAGRGKRRTGLGLELVSGGTGVVGGVLIGGGMANWWNPVGWTLLGGLAVSGIVAKLFGGHARRKAAAERARARSTARAEARASVNQVFADLEQEVVERLEGVVHEALRALLEEEVRRAIALRHLEATAAAAGDRIDSTLALLPSPSDPSILLATVARGLERTIHPGAPTAGRLLWLGEDWCSDPEGLEEPDEAPSPERTRAYDPGRMARVFQRLRAAISDAGAHPRPGSGEKWLDEVTVMLNGDADATDVLSKLRTTLDEEVPTVAIAGDYSAGKSSFIKRLLVDSGAAPPEGLSVGGAPETARATGYQWDGWRLIDTPGFQSVQDAHSAAAHEALAGASSVVFLFNPNLVVGDPRDLELALLGDESTGRVGKLHRAIFVINRADELGVDPHDDPDAFDQLRERKELELAQALAALPAVAASGARIDRDRIVTVASDPFGLVGDRDEVTSHDYSPHRDWDGMKAFHELFREPAAALRRNGVDVSVLEGGSAKLGALAAARRKSSASRTHEAAQLRRLVLDLRAAAGAGEALVTAAREQLAARLTAHAADQFDIALGTTDPTERAARVDQLQAFLDDPLVQSLVTEWAHETEHAIEDWKTTVAARVERRFTSAAFVAAFPALDDAIDLSFLAPAPHSRGQGKAAAKAAAGALEKVPKERVLEISRRLGHKFQPWGATKLTSKINVAGGALGLAFGAVEIVQVIRSAKKEDAADRSAAEARFQFVEQVRASAEKIFDGDGSDGSPAAVMHEAVAAVAAARDAVEAKATAINEEINRLEVRASACEDASARARAKLSGGHD